MWHKQNFPRSRPGKTVWRKFFEPLNLSVEESANALKIPPYQFQDLVDGKSKIDLEMAYRLGRYFQIEPEMFLNLQQRYDLEVWKDRQESLVKRQVKPRSEIGKRQIQP
ncbi:HigA family addiction module antitoxin [endosymbiont GvMRE of Glomus versiforme]|uniref:HigA family addiction module antitoxin n=1 Tax=endosymbiont GvMRE of Glomus versiforme TaxID=2039283 RepID=UPI0011C38BBF|nr:HigA family addiction module antitoxin [endosymbiont GvMRE of Glomus versiforme]